MLILEALSMEQSGLLSEVSLQLPTHQIHAIVGPNGAGKSSLLRAIMGASLSKGTVALDGQDLADWSVKQRAQQLALLSQKIVMSVDFTVHEIIAMGCYAWSHRDACQAVIAQVISLLKIQPLLARSYSALSGGEQQLVQFARILVQLRLGCINKTQFLLLDEVTTHLDLNIQARIFEIISSLLSASFGVVVVLHDLNIALRYADSVTVMHQGRAIVQGPVEDTLTPQLVKQFWKVGVVEIQSSQGKKQFLLE